MKYTVARFARTACFAGFPVLMAAAPVQALEMAKEMYVVASIGQSNIVHTPMQVSNNNIAVANLTSAAGAAFPTFSSTETSTKRGAKLQVGYQIDPNFAIEGGYVDLGKSTYSASHGVTTSTPTYSWWPKGPQTKTTAKGSSSREAKLTGWNVAALGIYPIDDRMSVFGKLGMIRAQVKTTDAGAGFNTGGSLSETKWRPTYGVGGNYSFNQNIGVRAELERFSKLGDASTTGSADVNLFSLGVVGRF
jgi:OOP family OmpA-OmpF porin